MEYEGVTIDWLGHDTFRFTHRDIVVYVDPFRIPEGARLASLVCVTHEHFDHCSVEDLQRVVSPHTMIVCATEAVSKVSRVHPESVLTIRLGERRELAGVQIEAVPAYNTNKYRNEEQQILFHPPEDGKLGFVVTINGVRIYHAGDTDVIPEMKGIECDVALLPVSGTYVMTPKEAAEAVAILKPKLAIPMHYGSIVGSRTDAEEFKRLADTQVEILG